MQCRTCGDHGNLSLLDSGHASLLPQLAAGCSVCHDCVVEIKHWSNFLHTFQTSQTRFQQVLHTQQTDVPLKVARVLVAKLLECDFCCFYTDNKTQLATHMQAHLHTTNTTDGPREHPANEGRKYNQKCVECGIRYRHPEMLAWHIENCHGTDAIVNVVRVSHKKHDYQCVFCSTEYKRLIGMIHHLRSQHRINNLPFHCNLCDWQIVLRRDLMKHQLICRGKKTSSDVVNHMQKKTVSTSNQQCKMCNEIFKSETLLKEHISQFHSAIRGRHKCLHCDETFKSIPHLKSHCHTRHPGKHVLQCDVCDVQFSSYGRYWEHKRFTHKNHVLVCNTCNAQYTSYSSYWHHKKHKHGETRVFTCDICNATFSNPNSLRRHKTTVHCQLTKSFSCQLCRAKFKCKQYLHHHEHTVHTGKSLHCNHCKFNTRRKSDLIQHLRWKHSLVKNTFSCRLCSAKFKCKEYLHKHVKTRHTGAILHCNHCNYNTRRRDHLTLHLKHQHF